MMRIWVALALMVWLPAVAAAQAGMLPGSDTGDVTAAQLGAAPRGGIGGAIVGSAPADGIATVARSLSAKVYETLDIRDFGAVCDGKADDYRAIQDAVDVATGYVPVGVAAAVPGAVRTVANRLAENLARWGVPGVSPNGAAEVVIPPGRCVSSQAIQIRPHAMNTMALVGAGIGVSELVFPAGTDGLVFTIPNGSTEARSAASPGAPMYLHGLSLLQADPADRTVGRAIVIRAPVPKNVPVVPVMIDQMAINAIDGRQHTTREWAEDIHIEDVQNVFVYRTQMFHDDYGQGSEADVHVISNSTGWTGDATTNVWIVDSNITGGRYALKVDGLNIQGVFVVNTPMTAVGHGAYWKSGRPAFNGPLGVINSGGSCQYDCIATDFVFTTRVFANQFIDGQGVRNTDWCAICVDNGGEASIVGNTMVNLPNTSYLGGGHRSVGIRFTQMPIAYGHAYPSVVSSNVIGPTDDGLILSGYGVTGSDNFVELNKDIPENCYQDRTPPSEPGRPIVSVVCGSKVLDVRAGGTVHQGAVQYRDGVTFNGGLMPMKTTVSALPRPCVQGDVRFATDAVRSGGGKGTLVTCLQTGWAAVQYGAVSTR